jgi:hypothetical protein
MSIASRFFSTYQLATIVGLVGHGPPPLCIDVVEIRGGSRLLWVVILRIFYAILD